MDPDKRERRQLKRAVKKAGNKKRRANFKRDLREHPEEAAFSEERIGHHRSDQFNGLDHDATRKSNGGDQEIT